MLSSTLIVSLFTALAAAAPAKEATQPRGICIPAVYPGTPPNITAITPGSAVKGLYLSNIDINTSPSAAILSNETTINRLVFNNGSIAAYMGFCSPFYLQIGTSDKSYKPLTWDFTEVDNIWNADFNSIISSKPTAATNHKSSSEFLACKSILSKASDPWTLYLQTGVDQPVGVCAETKLKVSKDGLDDQ